MLTVFLSEDRKLVSMELSIPSTVDTIGGIDIQLVGSPTFRCIKSVCIHYVNRLDEYKLVRAYFDHPQYVVSLVCGSFY